MGSDKRGWTATYIVDAPAWKKWLVRKIPWRWRVRKWALSRLGILQWEGIPLHKSKTLVV